MAAYAIARLDFPGKTLILTAALAIAMFPPISIVGPLYNLWRNLGLYDTWPGLIIPYMTFTLPLAIYTLSAFFREIPWELEQAAQVDGATPFQAFRKVIAPLAAPGVFTTAILVFIFAWNDFVFAISLTSTKRRADRAGGDLAFSGRLAVPRSRPARSRRRRSSSPSRSSSWSCSSSAGSSPASPQAPSRARSAGTRWPTSSSTTSPSATPTATRPSSTWTSRSPTASS